MVRYWGLLELIIVLEGGREGGGSKILLYCYKTVGTLVLSVLLVLLVVVVVCLYAETGL